MAEAEATTAGAATKIKSTASTVSPTVASKAYPSGHLGHLTADEDASLERFRAFLITKNAYKPGPPASHDDPTLLRYLRARKWNVEDAWQQFNTTEDWRAANNVDTLYDTTDPASFEESRRLYPQWTGRRDKRGIPLYLYELKQLDSKNISAYEKTMSKPFSKAKTDGKTPTRLLRLVALYENLGRFINPLCTNLLDREFSDTPITMTTNIVDVNGVSLRMFWNLKGHMQLASQLATAHYPETLDRIFIIGAPYFFPTVWGWVKRWFDPVTVSKIFILGQHEVFPTLSSFIDPQNIPKAYGGELDFAFGQKPNLDPAIEKAVLWENGHSDFPGGPCAWQPAADGKQLECLATGGLEGEGRHEKVGVLPAVFTWPTKPVAASEKTEAEP